MSYLGQMHSMSIANKQIKMAEGKLSSPSPKSKVPKSRPKGLRLTVLTVKVAQNDLLDSPSQKNWPGGQRDQGCGVVLHVQEEVYQ